MPWKKRGAIWRQNFRLRLDAIVKKCELVPAVKMDFKVKLALKRFRFSVAHWPRRQIIC